MSGEMREQQFMGARYKKPLLEKPMMPMKKTLFNHPSDMIKKQSLLGSPPDRHRWPATKRVYSSEELTNSPRSSPTFPNPPKRQALLPTPGEWGPKSDPVGLLPRPFNQSGLLPAPSSPHMYSPPRTASPIETIKQPLLPSVSMATHSPPPGLLPLPHSRMKEQVRCVEKLPQPTFQKPALLQTPLSDQGLLYQKHSDPGMTFKKNTSLLPLMPEQTLKAPLLKVPMSEKAPLLLSPHSILNPDRERQALREPLIPTPPVIRSRHQEFYPPKNTPVYPSNPPTVKRPLLPTPSLLF